MITCTPHEPEQHKFFLTSVGRWFLLVVIGTVLLLAPHSAVGQSSQGSLSGTVTDPQGAVIRRAKVTATATATNVTTSTVTNDAGIYVFTALNPGDYTISVAQSGFEQSVVKNVIISAAQKATVAVQLKIGHSSDQVTVTAQDSLLVKEETNVVTTVEHQLVAELPYPERSALEAALLVPGVNGDPLQPGGIATENPNAYLSYVTPGATISIGGGAPGTSSIYVDGSDVTQASYGRAGINLSGRLVGETTAITTGLSAKYGRTASGMIIQNSASGTEHYHGAVTWRHNDPFFNAIPYGSAAKSNNHENFYGFYFGGPVRIPKVYNGKGRTFFYVGVEPARLQSSSTSRVTAFTPDELAGKLNNSLPLLNQTILKAQGAAAALAAPRVGGIWIQTTSRDANGFPYGAQATVGNYIPVDAAHGYAGTNDLSNQLAKNPLAQWVLAHQATPSDPGPYLKFDRPDGLWANDGTNAMLTRGAQNIDNRYSFRIDHNYGSGDQIWGRFTNVPLTNHRVFGVDPSNPMGQVPSDSTFSKDIALGYTHIFTPTLVSNLRFSYMRVVQNRIASDSAMSRDWGAAYGLTPAVWGKGFPSLGSFNSNGIAYAYQIGPSISNGTSINRDQNFILGDDITWTKGKHMLQFGADIRWIQSNQYDLSGLMGGKYSFSQNTTNSNGQGGEALASFILGSINSYVNTPVSVPGYYRWKYYAGYLQDDWHVLPNLTLNLGLRYQIETPRSEANNNQGFIRLDQPGTFNGMPATAAFCFSDGCGGAKTLFPTNHKEIEPRVGISYAPTQRSTIRASYGLLHIPLTGYANTPDPNFNVGSYVGYYAGGINSTDYCKSLASGCVTNYMTNPIGPVTSAYTALNGARGPLYYVSGIPVEYIRQTDTVPYTQTWSLTVQYQLSRTTVFQASYQGLKGTHLIGPFSSTINTPSISAIQTAIQNKVVLGNTVNNPYGITQNGKVLTETGLQLLSPYQNYFNQNINEIYPRNGRSSYNALYMSVTHRFNRGLSALANFTWQKSLDDVSQTNGGNGGGYGYTSQQNPFDLHSEYSVSNFDQAARLKYGLTYSLPFGKGRYFADGNSILNAVLGDFSIAAIGSNADGVPQTVTLGTAGNFYSVVPKGTNGCNGSTAYCISGALPAGYTLRPDIVPGVPLINPDWKKNPFNSLAAGGITPYLNINAFAVPGSAGNAAAGITPTAAFGNAPRTLAGARSPREMMCDLRISKNIALGEGRYHLNLNATLNNAFNHPVYYGAGNTTIDVVTTTAGTGVIAHSHPARFAVLNQGQTGGMSRIIRVGAEFTF